MARATHRLIRTAVLLCLLIASHAVQARCISPVLTPTECDFKNEDTALWWLQPAWKLNANHRIDTVMANAQQSLDQYRSSLKTLGDDAIRARLNSIDTAVEHSINVATSNLALYLANDPFNLKPLYLDVALCTPFWQAQGHQCPTTLELPLDLNRLAALEQLREQIEALRHHPQRVLGEQWGEIGADFVQIQAQFNRARTLARQLQPETRLAQFRQRFPGYEQMINNPALTLQQWQQQRSLLSGTLRDTLFDTVNAAHVIGDVQLTADRDELRQLSQMNRAALGRLQVTEIENMNRTQSAQAWLKITEQTLNMNNLLALELADENWHWNTARAKTASAIRTDELRPTIVGNEQGLPLP